MGLGERMKARGVLLATLALLGAAPLTGAAERPRAPSPSKIVEVAEQFNELRYHKALAYITRDEEGAGSRTSYMKSPYERAADGGYTANIEFSFVTSTKGQPPEVDKSDYVFRLTAAGDRVLFSYGDVEPADEMDVELAGNGILMRPQNAARGVELMENLRRPDGSVRILQHLTGGTQRLIVFDEVAVRPEPRDNGADAKRAGEIIEFRHRVFGK